MRLGHVILTHGLNGGKLDLHMGTAGNITHTHCMSSLLLGQLILAHGLDCGKLYFQGVKLPLQGVFTCIRWRFEHFQTIL